MGSRKITSESKEKKESRATAYRRQAAAKDKFPALKFDFDQRADDFPCALEVPVDRQLSMCIALADAFCRTFGQPARLRAPSTVAGNVGRFGKRLEDLLYVYRSLDTQERKVAELVMMIEDVDFDLIDRMDELERLGRNFPQKLNEVRNSGSFPRTAGPEFDPRVRVLVLHLETIYHRYFDAEITRSKSVDGTYNGPFITFCRAACEHFLGAEVVKNATLEQAVLWVATRP